MFVYKKNPANMLNITAQMPKHKMRKKEYSLKYFFHIHLHTTVCENLSTFSVALYIKLLVFEKNMYKI
jgi:hypothetical protein